MRKLLLILAVLAAASCSKKHEETSETESVRQARSVGQAFDDGQGGEKLGLAIDAIVKTGARALREHGFKSDADSMEADWKSNRSRLMAPLLCDFTRPGTMCDMGDHKPLSEKLALFYMLLEAKLGHELCVMLHLTDINVINFTIPVVFHPQKTEVWCQETLAMNPNDNCEDEYRRHTAGTLWQKTPDQNAKLPLHDGTLGVVSYWVVFGACEVATYGAGWFIICSPLGDVVEIAMERYVAPPLSDKIFERVNQ